MNGWGSGGEESLQYIHRGGFLCVRVCRGLPASLLSRLRLEYDQVNQSAESFADSNVTFLGNRNMM